MSWANALGNILGSFSGSFGGGTDIKASKKLMAYQDQLARNSFQWKNENGWNFMRTGLVNADYNPLLAIGQSPIDAQMASATASQPTGSIDGASSMQAQTAKKMSDSQIMVNKATASKTAEEALTQQNIRSNYDSQTMMNMLTSERIKKLLPYEERKMIAETLVAHSMVGLNNANAAAAPRLAGAAEKQASAASQNVKYSHPYVSVLDKIYHNGSTPSMPKVNVSSKNSGHSKFYDWWFSPISY